MNNVYYLFIAASRVKRKYRIIGHRPFETQLADVSMDSDTYCNIY